MSFLNDNCPKELSFVTKRRSKIQKAQGYDIKNISNQIFYYIKNKLNFFGLKKQRSLFMNNNEGDKKATYKRFVKVITTVFIMMKFIKKLKFRSGKRDLNTISEEEISLINDITFYEDEEISISKVKLKCMEYFENGKIVHFLSIIHFLINFNHLILKKKPVWYCKS